MLVRGRWYERETILESILLREHLEFPLRASVFGPLSLKNKTIHFKCASLLKVNFVDLSYRSELNFR